VSILKDERDGIGRRKSLSTLRFLRELVVRVPGR